MNRYNLTKYSISELNSLVAICGLEKCIVVITEWQYDNVSQRFFEECKLRGIEVKVESSN